MLKNYVRIFVIYYLYLFSGHLQSFCIGFYIRDSVKILTWVTRAINACRIYDSGFISIHILLVKGIRCVINVIKTSRVRELITTPLILFLLSDVVRGSFLFAY